MNARHDHRAQQFLSADKGFMTGRGVFGDLFSRLLGRGFSKTIDRIDKGLEYGQLDVHLPDGRFRILGGRNDGPRAIVRLNHWRALLRLARSGSVGCYKSWELGEWESPDPVPLFAMFMLNRNTLGRAARASGFARLTNRITHFSRRNTSRNSQLNIAFHYDLGNDFYAAWLDDSMTYSSAIFDRETSGDETLECAQYRKMHAVMDRLKLNENDHVLEIGCGWGALSRYLARETGAHVTGITLSAEQLSHSCALAATCPEFDKLRYQLTDYRDMKGQFDGIASIEMVEAVGQDFWGVYLDSIRDLLKPGGRAAIQYIAIADDVFEQYATNVDFIQTYIFPGGMLLSESRFRQLAQERNLEWTDTVNFGEDYADTLKCWRDRFDAAVREGRLPDGFDEHFVNLWRFYLMYCEGGFRSGGIFVGQATLVKSLNAV